MSEECKLEKWKTCCCNCKYRLKAFDHETNKRIGWACIAFAFMEGEDIAYIGNFEHGMCELWTRQ